MTDLYTRILLWHKLVAMQTGGLALCSAKHKLSVNEARGWIEALRNVSDDIETFLKDGTFVLDGKGQRVVGSAGEDREVPNGEMPKEAPHVTAEADRGTVSPKKTGGLRTATKRKT